MSTNEKNPEKQAIELVQLNREIVSMVGEEAEFLMTTRADLMSLATLLIEKGVIAEGDFTNALFEGRKTILYQLKMNEAAAGDNQNN